LAICRGARFPEGRLLNAIALSAAFPRPAGASSAAKEPVWDPRAPSERPGPRGAHIRDSPPRSVKLHYVGIRVSNLRRSVRFYTKVLGLKETIRGDFRGIGRGIWVGLEDRRSKAKLELNWYPPGSRFGSSYRGGDALDHIGFEIGHASAKKLDQVYQRLLKSGARATPMTPEATGGWMACVQEPDGNWVEIFRRPTAAERRAERRSTSLELGPNHGRTAGRSSSGSDVFGRATPGTAKADRQTADPAHCPVPSISRDSTRGGSRLRPGRPPSWARTTPGRP
jgi:catechol 2,3-dioxygenase-like lactoylglutathione lyase family enzyme